MSMHPTDPQGVPAATQPRAGWWSRNWKWFVPLGCLTMIGLVVTFVAVIVVIVFGAMKSTDVYKDSLARAQKHPAVVEALGSPVDDGLFMSGKTEVNGASGEANLSVPISGPKGQGTLYIVAKKSAGQWNYEQLVVELAQGGERINLLQDAAVAQERRPGFFFTPSRADGEGPPRRGVGYA
jgi:hypothetical protein